MDTESFVIYIKTEDFYEDIASDIEKWLTHATMIRTVKDHFQ